MKVDRIFKILEEIVDAVGGTDGARHFVVQWVGYSAEAHNTTVETEALIRETAPNILEEFDDGPKEADPDWTE